MSTTRTTYQEGSVQRVKRANGPDVWVFRWRETLADGRRVHRKEIIGSVERYASKADAKRAAANRRAEINAAPPKIAVMTVEEAWGHFQKHELDDPEIGRSQDTKDNYRTLFAAHIIPRWGNVPLDKVEAVEVEAWLRKLTTVPNRPGETPRPLAPASKAKIKSRMYSLFEHAKRHKLCDSNPIETVRQGSKRLVNPAVVTLHEAIAIMAEVNSLAFRLAILVACATGLRRSEIRGLKWRDVDMETHWIRPQQGMVRKHETNLKTRASGEPVPIPEALSMAFLAWREQSPYQADDDWVFASPQTAGKRPYWFDAALVRHLRPAAKRANITKHIGWHTFRRSLATLLTARKEGVKVVQSLMRHADPRITLALYAQGEEESMRAAQEQHLSGLFIVDRLAS
jgi:integrase